MKCCLYIVIYVSNQFQPLINQLSFSSLSLFLFLSLCRRLQLIIRLLLTQFHFPKTNQKTTTRTSSDEQQRWLLQFRFSRKEHQLPRTRRKRRKEQKKKEQIRRQRKKPIPITFSVLLGAGSISPIHPSRHCFQTPPVVSPSCPPRHTHPDSSP